MNTSVSNQLTTISVLCIYFLVIFFVFCGSESSVHKKSNENSSNLKIRLTDDIVGRFRKAIQLQTIAYDNNVLEWKNLENLRLLIEKSYPTIHSSPLVTFEIISNYSLLYTIKGSDATLKPFMLLAHQDVVPVEPQHWKHAPFGGEIDDGYIYGRGTTDFKNGVFGILEALEFLLRSGYKPRRSFFIGFGHDEEVDGISGAFSIANILKSRKVKLEYVLDEGTFIISKVIKSIQRPIAIISTSEKVMVTIKLSVNMSGGHSSLPEKECAISVLAKAIARLEANPLPSMLGQGPEKYFFEGISSELSFIERILLSNTWLFSPLLSWILSKEIATNSIIRTTTTFTFIQGGVKENVIPHTAWAYLNHRIHPAQTLDEVLRLDRSIINDDRVHMEVLSKTTNRVPVSPHNTFGYELVKKTIEDIFHHINVFVVPGLMVGMTDSRHYSSLTPNVYRFSPLHINASDLHMFHGNDERISLNNYELLINFYYSLLVNSDSSPSQPFHHSHTADL